MRYANSSSQPSLVRLHTRHHKLLDRSCNLICHPFYNDDADDDDYSCKMLLSAVVSDPLRHHSHRQLYDIPSHEMMMLINNNNDNDNNSSSSSQYDEHLLNLYDEILIDSNNNDNDL
jgi:hypothetical protein